MSSLLCFVLFGGIFCLSYSISNYYQNWWITLLFSSLCCGCTVIYYRCSRGSSTVQEEFSKKSTKRKSSFKYQSLTGVLVDVSASMEEGFSLDRTVSGEVERSHAIITTLNGIANKESVAHGHRQDHVFVSAFGLKDVKTCDLIHLLNYKGLRNDDDPAYEVNEEANYYAKRSRANPRVYQNDMYTNKLNRVRKDKEDPSYSYMTGHEVLIKFATKNNAPHAKRWIQKSLTEEEAGVLYTILSRDEKLTKEFIEKLPNPITTQILSFTSAVTVGVIDGDVKNSEAYKLARKVIYRFADVTTFLQKPEVQIPQIWPVKEISDLLDKILKNHNTSFQANTITPSHKNQLTSVHDHESSAKVKDLFDYLTPFIFGRTPMVESLTHAKQIFDQNQDEANKKVLFILSDGVSTDGDPLPIAKDLHAVGVILVACYLTTKKIEIPRRLTDKKTFNFNVDQGAAVLFKMSSSMHNTEVPVSYFVDAGWELPTSGESNLYFQANSLDLVDEFCNIVFSHMKKNTCADALVDIIAHVSVADYINVVNSTFKPNEQIGFTCYANAVAAVYHLAMCRIVDRQGGVPSFKEILDVITSRFDKNSEGNTKFAMERTCSEYRLQFREVDERGAREAINERRPVVATFKFINQQQERDFGKFFHDHPRDILKSGTLSGLSSNGDVIGHAVVLVRCEPSCLKFMNSWGQKWGDGGFFRIQNSDVLHEMKFFDVFWKEDDLYPSEKEAFRRKGVNKAESISQTFSSLNELDYECPKCHHVSKVGAYSGNLLEAKCPKCKRLFKPDHEGVMQSLYISSRDFA